MTTPVAALSLPDLASRDAGGAVVHCTDELFADAAHLLLPSHSQPRSAFGLRGKVYDGWETRRRRTPDARADLDGTDAAIVRLGVPGVIRAVVVDTAFFRGNYPPWVWLEAAEIDGHPSAAELTAAHWSVVVPRSPARGDHRNVYDVHDERRWTHVRLVIQPDGGVARLRVHGEQRPDTRWRPDTVDLAAASSGGLIEGCSNRFYSAPGNVLADGRPASMGDGWETARRRDAGNEWVVVQLGLPGTIDDIVLDTSYFVGNAPAAATVSVRDRDPDTDGSDGTDGTDGGTHGRTRDSAWRRVLDRVPLRPDTPHRFAIDDDAVVTHVRVDIHPDGGLARLRVNGRPRATSR